MNPLIEVCQGAYLNVDNCGLTIRQYRSNELNAFIYLYVASFLVGQHLEELSGVWIHLIRRWVRVQFVQLFGQQLHLLMRIGLSERS